MTTNRPSISGFLRASKSGAAAVFIAAVAMATGGQTAAQHLVPPSAGIGVATLDREVLFLRSKFGQRVQKQLEADRNALEAENRAMEAELIAEERALTEERSTLSPAEFTQKANEFDARVQSIRQEQDQKGLGLQRQLESERQKFLNAIIPVLNELLVRQGTSVLLDRNAVIFAIDSVDITAEAIALIDQRIGEGAAEDAVESETDAPQVQVPLPE